MFEAENCGPAEIELRASYLEVVIEGNEEILNGAVRPLSSKRDRGQNVWFNHDDKRHDDLCVVLAACSRHDCAIYDERSLLKSAC